MVDAALTEDQRRIQANRFIDSHFEWVESYGVKDWFDMQDRIVSLCPNVGAKLNLFLERLYSAKVAYIRGTMAAAAFMDAVEDWSVLSLDCHDKFSH